jgi:type II secretory pathway pseudopilin PulG
MNTLTPQYLQHPPPRDPRRAAFSLIEVILALGVVTIGLIAILAVLPQGMAAARDATDQMQAGLIADDLFNTMRAGYPWMDFGSGPIDISQEDVNGMSNYTVTNYYNAQMNERVGASNGYYMVKILFGSSSSKLVSIGVFWPAVNGPPPNNTLNQVVYSTQLGR